MLMVTGANGQFAQATIRELRDLVGDDVPIAVTTRDTDTPAARRLADDGITVRRADFADPDSLAGVFDGVTRALIVSTMAPNEVRFRLHANAIDAAVAAGVGHLVYTSFIDAGPDAITEHSRLVHFPTERHLADADVDVTILRHSLYAETLLDDLEMTLATGVFARPGGDAAAAYIARDDLGRSAAHVLAGSGHAGRSYTETMAAPLTGAEIAEHLSEAAGRRIRYERIPPEAWPARLSNAIGVPEAWLGSAEWTMRALEAGDLARTTDDFSAITGRAPTTMAEFLAAQLAARAMR